LNKKEILEIQKLLKEIYVSDNIFEYVGNIIEATRNKQIESVSKYLEY
jgi:vacuolar-type H+-ATPase catalytic subunit A/Vma1